MERLMRNHLVETLAWDSDFFDFGVGRLNASSIEEMREGISLARQEGKKLLYFAADSKSALAKQAKQEKLQFVGDQVLFKMDLKNAAASHKPNHFHVIPYAKRAPTQQLIDLAIQAGWMSRYSIDPNFSQEQFFDLYKAWIENSCRHEVADIVMTAENLGADTLGLVTVRTAGSASTIGLISVSNNHRRQGVASALTDSAVNFSINQNCDSLFVSTQQNNKNACALYQSQGFSVEKSESWFHAWIGS